MKTYVGIDLGTTNSAICSYDGMATRIWKSPEQNDVTPSAIYMDKRGNKYVGKRAYDSAPYSPDSSAMLFKRLMGTNTPLNFTALGLTMSPEECSAEILKVLFGYLPEEIRNGSDTGTVITVPAVFDQMQKDATMQAANIAGIGKIALMQEPVAAVMSVMRTRNTDGMFLIYDLGGGTLDIAIAQSIGGRVSMLAHGGIAMCGGREFDRLIVDSIVRPWLLDTFSLPDNFMVDPSFKSLVRLATWATEKAKIELSSVDEAVISLSETETRTRDLKGKEIYFDIPLPRRSFDSLIDKLLDESTEAVRATVSKAGLTPHDLERIVFIGGPTHYKPLRDKVAIAVGIPGTADVNPMTAVAEGAGLFAESVDWSSQSHSRKSSRGQMSSGGALAVTFAYNSRTPDVRSRIVVQIAGQVVPGSEFQIDSVGTGWTSGRVSLKPGASIDVTLHKAGENVFKVFVFDSLGGPLALEQDKIIITRTAATVDAIPASHSIGVEVLEKLGGRPVLHYLVRAGDALPKKGRETFKAAESLKAGAASSLNFKLWEGEIEDPVTDNRAIGVLKIAGSDFDDGVIPAGANLECEYEIRDSGNIMIEVSAPCIGGTFHSDKNFYSRQEGQRDYSSDSQLIVEEGEQTLSRIDKINEVVDDPRIDQAREKLDQAILLDTQESDPETAKKAHEDILAARRILAQVRKEHLREIRQIDLDLVVSYFDDHIRQYARPSEETAFDNLAKTAQRSIERNDRDFEYHVGELRSKNFEILWRQDWFVIDRFNYLTKSPQSFSDKIRFKDLARAGAQLLQADDIDQLRDITSQLYQIRIFVGSEDDMSDPTNIMRG